VFVWFDTRDKGRVWIEPQTDTPYVQPEYETKQTIREGTRYFYSSDTSLAEMFSGWAWPDMLLRAEVADSKYYLNCAPGGDVCTGWKPRVGELPTPTSDPGTGD
jgi:glucan-binding YG repeat protein